MSEIALILIICWLLYITIMGLVGQHPCYDGWNAGLLGNCLHGPSLSGQSPNTN